MDTAPVRFESPAARDVAALVLEELSVSPAVRSWFLEAIGLEPASPASELRPVAARESTGDAAAEPDGPDEAFRAAFEVDLAPVSESEPGTCTSAKGEPADETASERVRLRLTTTIETRLEDGLDRTLPTAEGTLEDTGADADEGANRTVLIAPAEALGDGDGDGDESGAEPPVDATVSLEALRERLAARETDRGDYRAALVAAAIGRGERAAAARATADGRRAALVDRYESLAADRDLTLDVEFGTGTGAGAETDLERVEEGADPFADGTHLTIDAPGLGDDHRLVHDLESGTVDLRIPGAGSDVEIFAARHAGAIPTATTLLTAGDALVLRRSAPAIDPADGDPAADAELADRIDAALEAVADHLGVAERVRERSS